VNLNTDSFESPLTLAACGGHTDLALLLLEHGANVEEPNDDGYTPLMEACRDGHEELVELLLEWGACVNATTEDTGETALTLACAGGHKEVVELLLDRGADIEPGTNSPLLDMASEGRIGMVRFLLRCGASVDKPNPVGETALTLAAEQAHTDVCILLLEWGADINYRTSADGQTALMKACRAGHYYTVQFLLSKGADAEITTIGNEHCALSLACLGGHLSVVELLLRHGVDINRKMKKSIQLNWFQLKLIVCTMVDNGNTSSIARWITLTPMNFAAMHEGDATLCVLTLVEFYPATATHYQEYINNNIRGDELTLTRCTDLVFRGQIRNIIFTKNVTCSRIDGNTVIMEAAKGGHTSVMHLLLDWPNVSIAMPADPTPRTQLQHQPIDNVPPPPPPVSLPSCAELSTAHRMLDQNQYISSLVSLPNLSHTQSFPVPSNPYDTTNPTADIVPLPNLLPQFCLPSTSQYQPQPMQSPSF
uniref:Ankyrin repeat domain 17 n=1 Tax=Romanomermis culicivorax TaxID=13658 RepID=A0A915KWT0_ROMCU